MLNIFVKRHGVAIPVAASLHNWRSAVRLNARPKHYTIFPYLLCSPALSSLHARASHVITSAAAAAAAAQARQDAGPVPAHWTDHLSHLRPGERRALRRYFPLVTRINDIEPQMQALSDSELSELTASFRSRLANGESIQSLLPEAFAAVREASSRVLGLRHYDVQLLGGAVLAEGQVAEMQTGEGKTLVAALPAYLFALTGRGVHVVTVNDYLAQRDADWVGKVLRFMGLSVGVITGETSPDFRAEALAADVTYITAYELAFTFLQDNLAPSARSVALKRPLHFAIVDEVDSLLIDEARNPFIISGPNSDVDASPAWRCAVSIASKLRGAPTGADGFVDPVIFGCDRDTLMELDLFDFLPDLRYKSAAMTPRGMTRAVRALASMGQLTLAVPLIPPSDDGTASAALEPASNSSASLDSLYAVLISQLDDGRCSLEIRSVSEGAARGITGSKKPNDPSPSPAGAAAAAEGLYHRTLTIDGGPEAIESTLHTLGLEQISPNSTTDAQWRAAAPAVLWTGGGRAWGRFLLQALRAVHLYRKDIDYIVRGGQVVIIDAASGRERERSRWQAGLHQALEAKESINGDTSVQVKSEDYDRGRVTYQSLFTQYEILSGMTGTASTEAEEFGEAYGLKVVRVPPHRPSRRIDNHAVVYSGEPGWEQRLQEIIRASAAARRPVLLGTSSVEESEKVVQVVGGIFYEANLSDQEVDRLTRALEILPQRLPAPPVINRDSSSLSKEEKNSLEMYDNLREAYEGALSVLRRTTRSRHLGPFDATSARDSAALLSYLASSERLLLPEEEIAAVNAVRVLRQVLSRSTLDKNVPINLLNARPDRVRREAETIAQAGLPKTITVATSMAGRGTDILLGGNPKGLTLMALKHFFLPVLVPRADDLADWVSDKPLAGLHYAFRSEADLNLHLPRPIFAAFKEAKKASMEMAALAATGSASSSGSTAQLQHAESPSSSLLSSARDASTLLSQIVEAAESDRSHFQLEIRRQGLVATPESALAWAQEREKSMKEDEGKDADPLSPAASALRRYALLQWLWFDTTCENYAAQVRAAGGLAIVISSVPETRRSEAQLRGRAGRQGDPGETFLLSSREDPAIASLLLPGQYENIWKYVDESGGGYEPIPAPMDRALVLQLMRSAEQLQQGAREVTRRYDAIVDPYRRHVYRLRRTLAGGGDAVRAALTHRHLRSLAADVVSLHVDANAPIDKWHLKQLLEAVESLVTPQDDAALLEDIASSNKLDSGAVALRESGVNGEVLHLVLNTGSEETAVLLADALMRNKQLPPATLKASLACPLPITRRSAWQSARREAESDLRPQGKHAAQAHRLQLWIGDLFAWLYEYKRCAVIAAARRRLPPCHTIQAGGILRIWERDTFLECLDALWSDFLQDSTVLQRASQSRAFSMLDPLDEYNLEASAAFSRLLTDFSRQSAVAMLGAVDVRHLQGLERRFESGNRGNQDALVDVEWASKWIVENENGSRVSAAGGAPILESSSRVDHMVHPEEEDISLTTQEDLVRAADEITSSSEFDALLGKIAGRLMAASPEQLREAAEMADERAAQRDRE